MKCPVSFRLFGKKAFVIPKTNRAIVVDANPKTKPWEVLIKHVAGGAENVPEEPWRGPVGLAVRLWMPRPVSVPKERLGYPTTRPDALKLCRAIEDALSHIIYHDDCNVVDLHIQKRYGPPGVDVAVWRITKPYESDVPLSPGLFDNVFEEI